MDLFEEYLSKEKEYDLIKRALTDKSLKHKNHSLENKDTNKELATYGDSIIKFCYSKILFDKVENITVEKQKIESDKYLVDVVAKHYDLIPKIYKDDDDNLAIDYKYDKYKSKNRNRSKYIATAVEAMIAAIYIITNELDPIIELLDSWRKL